MPVECSPIIRIFGRESRHLHRRRVAALVKKNIQVRIPYLPQPDQRVRSVHPPESGAEPR